MKKFTFPAAGGKTILLIDELLADCGITRVDSMSTGRYYRLLKKFHDILEIERDVYLAKP